MTAERHRPVWRWMLRGAGACVILVALADLLILDSSSAENRRKEVQQKPSVKPLVLSLAELPPPPPMPLSDASAEASVMEEDASLVALDNAAELGSEPAMNPELSDAAEGADAQPDESADRTPIQRRQSGAELLAAAERGETRPIRIAWPDDPAERNAVDASLHGCHGMRNALLDAGGQFVALEPGMTAADLNNFSQLLREPEGALPERERQRWQRLNTSQPAPAASSANQGRLVRLFPREFDTALFAVLAEDVGDLSAEGWRARYRHDGQGLWLEIQPQGGAVQRRSLSVGGCG